jgi:hypothetical protein
MSTAIIFALLAGAPAADAGKGETPGADVAKARALVKQLADDKFRVRDAAEKELLALGLASLDALKEGEKHSDAHVRERCRLLQPAIRWLILERRVKEFLAKPDGPLPKELPLVASFMKVTGDTKESRTLYADLVRAYSTLLAEFERDKKKAGEQFVVYCQDIAFRMQFNNEQSARNPISRVDVALYLLGTRELSNELRAQMFGLGHSFLQAPALTSALGQQTAAALPLRKLFLDWLERSPDPFMLQQGLQVAVDARMKEAAPLIVQQIKKKGVPAYFKAQTTLLLGRVGGKEHLADVEPLLDDKTMIGNVRFNNFSAKIEMRDVALAVCVKLSGQKLADFGFNTQNMNEEIFTGSYIYCGFATDAKRDAAHKKYKDAKAAPKADAPKEKPPEKKEPKEAK